MSDKVMVTGNMVKYYESKGYNIPKEVVQLWKNKNWLKVKNGKDFRILKGTQIEIDFNDLSPSSNKKITINCIKCFDDFTTTFGAYKKKKFSNRCADCQKKNVKNTGCHSYWVKKLITDNPNAACDISGENDKRFLVLHHLQSVKSGGKNMKNNYVVLSANYHMAFHNSFGGTNIICNKQDYINFKNKENCRLNF